LHTDRDRRRDTIDRAVKVAFDKARGLHGSPRLHADLRADGWTVSEKTVADSMRRQGLIARRIKRRSELTRQDKTAPKFPDLLRRDFTADRPNARWVGDMTEIPTGADGKGPKLYLATVIDLYSRRLLGAATSLHPDAQLACAAITMAVAARGGKAAIWREDEAERVIFHTDRGSTYTAAAFAGSARVSTTPPRRRSSPRWSGRSSPDTTWEPWTRPARSCWTGATASTTTTAGTARPA
jgi:transposase InsO family protein